MGLPPSVENAVKAGIKEELALMVWRVANRLVERGKWIPVGVRKPKFSISDLFKHLAPTSVITYWGPREVLVRAKKGRRSPYTLLRGYGSYDLITTSQAEKLFKKGFLGKMHEVVGGSMEYPTWRCPSCKARNRFENSEKLERCSRCGVEIPEGLRRELKEKLPSHPIGGVVHRHWELIDMIRYFSRSGRLDSFLKAR